MRRGNVISRVCLSVCLSVMLCDALIFDFDLESLFLVRRNVFGISR